MIRNNNDLDAKFLAKTTLSISDMARLCGKPYNTIKRWHARGRIPGAYDGFDGPQWPADRGWMFALDQGFRVGEVPFLAWPEVHRDPVNVESRSYGIEVIYRHPLGELRVIYPRHGHDSIGDRMAHRPNGVTVWFKPSLVPKHFYHVTIEQPGMVFGPNVGSDDVARIVGGTLPYWPEGLRSHVVPDRQLADMRDERMVSALEMRPELVGEPLRSILRSRLDVDLYSAYTGACSDIEEAKNMGHFDIRVRPIKVDEPSWEDSDIDIPGVLAQVEPTHSEAAAPFVWRICQDIEEIRNDHPLRSVMMTGATALDRSQWTLAHHALAYAATYIQRLKNETVDDSQLVAYHVPGFDGLYVLDAPDALRFYCHYTVHRCPDEFDAFDPNLLLVRFDETWMPIPVSERGYYIGGNHDADVSLDILDKLVHGPYPVTSASYDRHPWGKFDGRGGQLRFDLCPKRFGPGWIADMLNTSV